MKQWNSLNNDQININSSKLFSANLIDTLTTYVIKLLDFHNIESVVIFILAAYLSGPVAIILSYNQNQTT